MKFSENQIRAKAKIERIALHFGENRWFIQEEVIGAGYKTMMALVNKGVLVTKTIDGKSYYQKIGKVTVSHRELVPAEKV